MEGDRGRLDVDDVFAKTLEDLLQDFRVHAPDEITPEDADEGQPSLFQPGYRFLDVPAGILLISPDGDISGGYLSCDLVVAASHRGKGLGMELIIERCLRDGENPVLNLDASAYSRAGLRSHRMAWNHARSHPRETRTRYCLLYTSPSPRDATLSRMPSSA